MNLILLDKSQCADSDSIELDERQARHVLEVLGAKIGTELNVGVINGPQGRARVAHCDHHANTVNLQLLPESLADSSPAKLPLKLVIALPRPKVARRLVQTCAELGVAQLHFIHSYRVEKSYWSSPLLEDDSIAQAIQLGLEQSRDCKRLQVEQHRRFKPFVEDVFSDLANGDHCVLAHPELPQSDAALFNDGDHADAPKTVVIGPEGGFIDYEVERLLEAGCALWQLGPRIYRVESVVPLVIGRLGAHLRD